MLGIFFGLNNNYYHFSLQIIQNSLDKKKGGGPDIHLKDFKKKEEVENAVRELQKRNPSMSKEAVKKALIKAALEIGFSADRKKVLDMAHYFINAN